MQKTISRWRLAFSGLIAFLLAWVAVGASPTMAQWQVIPDGEGAARSLTLRGQLDGNALFQIWCRGPTQHIALLQHDGSSEALPSRGNDLLFQIVIDGSPAWSGPGDPYRHADGWAGIRYRLVQQARGIAESIAAAKRRIAVVVTDSATGQQSTFTAAAEGSGTAARDFLFRCFGVSPSIPPSAEQLPSPGTTAEEEMPAPSGEPLRHAKWQVKEDATGATLMGLLDETNMLAMTCSKEAILRVIKQDGRNEPPRDGLKMALSLSFDDGEQFPPAAARVVRLASGYLAFETKINDKWVELIGAMWHSRRSVKVAVTDQNSGQSLEWSVSPAGLANAALEQHVKCIVRLF